jgi:hypothetical protein
MPKSRHKVEQKSQRPTLQEPRPAEMQQDIDRILDRLDTEIPEAQKRMDDLLARLRATRIVVAA